MEQGQERTTQKRTGVSQIFDIFAPQNCDQKVTKFCSEKNLLVGKKKKKSPPVGQTLGSDDPPEGRSLVTERPLQKKNIDTSVRSTVRRGAQ